MDQSGAVTPPDCAGKFQPSLLELLLPIEWFDEDPDNVRLHSEENLHAIKTSLDTFGQTKPIVFRDIGRRRIVIAGNGNLREARELGWTHIAAVEFRGSAAMAKAYAIADNRIPELAQWDSAKLEAQLSEIGQEWSAEGLDWQADTIGLTPEFRESLDSGPREPQEPSDKPPEFIDVQATVLPDPPTTPSRPCTECGSVETVCATCVLREIETIRALLSPSEDALASLASDCWLTTDQVTAVLAAVRSRNPVLA